MKNVLIFTQHVLLALLIEMDIDWEPFTLKPFSTVTTKFSILNSNFKSKINYKFPIQNILKLPAPQHHNSDSSGARHPSSQQPARDGPPPPPPAAAGVLSSTARAK